MLFPGNWAKAFINSLEREGIEIEEGIDTLSALVSQVKSLPGAIFGRSASEKLEKLLRDEIAKFSLKEKEALALELTVRFLILTIRKNMFRHINLIIKEAKKILDKKRGVIEVSVEYAAPSWEKSLEESRLTEAVKKRTGALKVVFNNKLNTELVGGYRIKIGDKLIDASARYQLENLLTALQKSQLCLAAGDGG